MSAIESVKPFEYLEQIMADPSINIITPEEEEPYHVFLKIINKSGEEICGRVINYNKDMVWIRPDDLIKREEGDIIVLSDEMASVSLLDSSYPPRFAHDYVRNPSTYPSCYKGPPIVQIEFKEKKTRGIVGVLEFIPTINYKKQRYQTQICIDRDPFEYKSSLYEIKEMSSISAIPEESVLSYEGDRNNEIGGSLTNLLLPQLTSIVTDYLSGAGPDTIPEKIYSYYHKGKRHAGMKSSNNPSEVVGQQDLG